jgi:hypothetical protein
MKTSKIITVILILAAIVTILTYFGIKPTDDSTNQQSEKSEVSTADQTGGTTAAKIEENINVTSNNQSGGITAGKVTVGRSPRRLTPKLIAQIDQHLPSDMNKVIEITSVMGDQEAFQFAEKIKTHIESKGRKVNGVNQAIFNRPVKGQIIEPTENGIKIIIGGRD